MLRSNELDSPYDRNILFFFFFLFLNKCPIGERGRKLDENGKKKDQKVSKKCSGHVIRVNKRYTKPVSIGLPTFTDDDFT